MAATPPPGRPEQASAIVVCSEPGCRPGPGQWGGAGGGHPQRLPLVSRPVGKVPVGSPPTVLFQGLLSYPPNIDAARWLAGEVGPRCGPSVPGVAVRLVGEHGPELWTWTTRRASSVVGRVPDMTAELARADLVAVPIRYGSGTRVKIIEAFAHRVPVVSTTVGAEGIGAADGVHLLMGDDPGAWPGPVPDCCRIPSSGTGSRRRPTPSSSETSVHRCHRGAHRRAWRGR